MNSELKWYKILVQIGKTRGYIVKAARSKKEVKSFKSLKKYNILEIEEDGRFGQ